MQDYDAYDMIGLAELVANGDVTPGELLDAALARVEARNPALNAVVHLYEDTARRRIAEGLPDGPLKGVPFLLKDLGAEAEAYPASNGSRLLHPTNYLMTSSIVERLEAAGLVVFGRTASPEGGIGPVTEAAVYGGPTRNPWNTDHTSGGSSGGAGAAVAARIVPAAHGSDGGGSVRIPASSCGLVGLKPSRARLPDGPYAGEGWAGMATDGYLTHTLRDTAALLDATEGPDLGAPYCAPPLRESYTAALGRAPGRLRIALCDTTYTGEPIHPDCAAAVHEAGKLLEGMGHIVEPACPDRQDHRGMMAAWTLIVACGTASWVRRKLKKLGRGLEPGDLQGVARSAVAYAEATSGTDYLDAVETVHDYGRAMAGWFQDWDILLSATLAEPPAKVGRFTHDRDDYLDYRTGKDGVFAYSPFTASANATGQPAISLPLGQSAGGLPIGVHLTARFGDDERLTSLAAEIERAAPWIGRRPVLAPV